MMGIPVVLTTGKCYAVLEFVRYWDNDPFSEMEFELTNAIMSWVTACVQKMKLNKVVFFLVV